MNEESQHRKILSFLDKRSNKDIDNFCIFQWIERCHFQGWWGLAIELAVHVPPNSLDRDYHKRLDFILKDCREKLSERRKPAPSVERIGRTVYVRPKVSPRPADRDLTGTLVRGFRLEGIEYRADSHKDVFVQIIKIAFERHPNAKERVMTLRGAKRKYFSRDKRDLSNHCELLPGTQIWVELQQNANTLYVLGKEVLRLCGMDDRSFEIMTAGVFRRPYE
jgi:hypothetical protein